MPKKPCAWTQSDHHSDDLMEVYHGKPEPTYLCGYHESRSHGIYSEVKALGEPAVFRLDRLADQADAAFQADATERYEDLNEEIRTLVDQYPKLTEQATARGILGGGPADGATAPCRHCGGDIEFDSGNASPWTHTDTGFSDCPVEDGDEPSGFHAEPTT